MNLVIKVTAGDAVSTVKTLGSEAGKAETAASRVGTAGSKAMADVAASASKASAKTRELADALAKTAASFAADAFGKLNAAFQREADIIERIRGPMREYKADMDALDRLFKSGTLSVAEYNDELARLVKTQGTMHGPAQSAASVAAATAPEVEKSGFGHLEDTKLGSVVESIAPRFGVLGELFGSVATKGNIATAVFTAMAVEASALGNEYIQLSNKAQKLTAKGGDVNETLRQQMELSRDLHGSLDGTIELYDAVRDGTDELNLSTREQIDLARDIGSAVVASGKSVEQAGGLMSKLTYAFASGSIGGRELKGIMKEFPDIGSAFVETLGHSRKELIAMANAGQLSADMLIGAFNRMGPEMQEKVGKKAETTGQMFGHLKDALVLSVGRVVESTGMFKALGAVLDGVAKGFAVFADVVSFVGEHLAWFAPMLAVAVESIKLMKDAIVGLAEIATDAWGAILNPLLDNDTEKQQQKITKAYLLRMEALSLLSKEEEKNARTSEIQAAADRIGVSKPGAAAFNEGSANKWSEARITLKQMGIEIGQAFSASTSEAMAFDAAVERIKESKAGEKIAQDAQKIWKEMTRTNDVINGQAKAWEDLKEKASEYKDALARVTQNHSGSPDLVYLRDDIEIMRGARDVQIQMNVGLGEYGKVASEAAIKTAEHKDAIDDLKGAFYAGKITLKEFADGMKSSDDVLDAQTKRWSDLTARLGEYNKAVDLINSDRKDHPDIAISRADVDALRGQRDTTIELDIGLGQYGKTLVDVTQKVNQHKDSIDDLRGAIDSHVLSAAGEVAAYKELKALLMDDPTYKLWSDMQAPATAWAQSFASLNALYKLGTIDLRRWNDEMLKAASAMTAASYHADDQRLPTNLGPRKMGKEVVSVSYDYAPKEERKPYDASLLKDGAEWQHKASLTPNVDDKKYLDQVFTLERWKFAQTEATEALRDTSKEQAVAATWATRMLELEASDIKITDELAASEQAMIRARTESATVMAAEQQVIAQFHAPQEAYRVQLAAAGDLLERGRIGSDEYSNAVDKIRASYLSSSDAGKTFAGGMESAWLKMKSSAEDVGKTLAEQLTGSVDTFNDAIVKAANDGAASWSSFGQSMADVANQVVQDLEKMLLKYLEMQAIQGILTLVGGGGGGGGAAASLIDLGQGSRGFATGGSFTVGGNGGTDTTPVGFMATPGERVTIQTPAQQGAGGYTQSPASAPSAPAAPPTIHVHVTDPSVVHAYMASPAGTQLVLDTIRRNSGAVRPSRGG